MSEVLRELVVALSLDSDNFARNLRTINKQIKEAESTFTLAGAGIEKFEGSVQGTEAKLSMLGQKLTNQKLAVDQYSRALVAANQKLVDSHARQVKMTQALEAAKQKFAALPAEIDLARARYAQPEYCGIVKVAADSVNLRTGAGSQFSKLATAKKGAIFERRPGDTEDWYAILYRGKEAFANKQYCKTMVG